MATTINNNASVIYNYTGSGESETITTNTASVNLQTTSNISVTKTANPTTFVAGDIITYTVVITNTGPNFLTGVRIIDNLGGGNMAYVLGSATLNIGTQTYPVTPVATNPLTFTLQQLNVGDSMTLTYRSQVIFNLPSTVNNITNSLQAIGYTSTTTYTAFANETIQKKNNDEFSVTKSVSDTDVYQYEPFYYTITLSNGTDTEAEVTSITDALPENFELLNVSLRIGAGPATELDSTDYTFTNNVLVVPSGTGPNILVPANDTAVLTIYGYLI